MNVPDEFKDRFKEFAETMYYEMDGSYVLAIMECDFPDLLEAIDTVIAEERKELLNGLRSLITYMDYSGYLKHGDIDISKWENLITKYGIISK